MQDPKRRSVTFGRRENKLLNRAHRQALDYKDNVSQSHIVRQAVRLLARDDVQDVIRKEWTYEAQLQDKDRRIFELERMIQVRDQSLEAERIKGRKQNAQLERIMRQLPVVRSLVEKGSGAPSGDPLLDQIWANAAYSWRIVLGRLEQQAKQLQDREKTVLRPDDPPPGAAA